MSLKNLRNGIREHKNQIARREGASMDKSDRHSHKFRSSLADNLRGLRKKFGNKGARQRLKEKYLSLKRQGMV